VIAMLVALQLALPLGLLAWLAWAPAGSRLGFLLQVAATGITILALALTGLWLVPPWWAPYLYGILLILVVMRGARRGFDSAAPFSTGPRLVAILFPVLGAVAGARAIRAWQGRAPPDGVRVVDLAIPFETGRYLVVNGGNHLSINAHLKTLDPTVARFHRWRGNSHAVDLVGITRLGSHASGLRPSRPEAYVIYGARIVAPCAGTVLLAEGSMPDQPVPGVAVEQRAGNFVMLRCAGADVVLAHFRPGTVAVRVGEVVTTGRLLGRAGNSGASDEPHLHIHAQRPGTADAPMSGDPLPITIGGRYLVRGNRIRVR